MSPPLLLKYVADDQMVEDAFRRADQLAQAMNSQRSGIAIVAFSGELFRSASVFRVSTISRLSY